MLPSCQNYANEPVVTIDELCSGFTRFMLYYNMN